MADEEGIRAIIDGFDDVTQINELLTMHMGPDFILANCSIDFPNDLSAELMEKTITEIDMSIKAQYPAVKRVFIEAESRLSFKSAYTTT